MFKSIDRLNNDQLDDMGGLLPSVIAILKAKDFRDILVDEEANQIKTSYYFDPIVLTLGQENIYLENTPFWSKDDHGLFIDLLVQMYKLE
jgi:hypothetical protein